MQNEERTFFAAANSGDGFASFYKEVFGKEGIERRFLIKGGPGTGKSTFMRRIAQKSLENGLCVDYYRCSSDPESLDAIVIAGRIALIDATSPHCVEPELVGARDELVDLGAFWDAERLSCEIDRIKSISEKKKERYRAAYRFLDASMTLDAHARELAGKLVQREKMLRAVQRIMKRIPRGEGHSVEIGLRDSIGMKGKSSLDTYEKMADKVYFIRDFYKSGALLLSMLASEAARNDNAITVSYYPLDPSYLDALFFKEAKIAFVLCESEKFESNGDHIYINMKRFVNPKPTGMSKNEIKELKREYKEAVRLSDGLVSSAVEALEGAGQYHFELEKIYKDCMDFTAESELCERFAKKIVGMLQKMVF